MVLNPSSFDAGCDDLPIPHKSRVEVVPEAISGVQAVKDALAELKAKPIHSVDCKLSSIRIEQLAIADLQRPRLAVALHGRLGEHQWWASTSP